LSIWKSILGLGVGASTGGASLALPLIGGAASAVAAGLGARKRKTTQTTSTRRILTPDQEAASGTIMGEARALLADPGADLAPMKTAATADINNNYTASAGRLDAELARRGRSGRGGVAAGGLRQLESGRLDALSQLENSIGQMRVQRRDKGLDLLSMILQMNNGQESTTTGTTPGNVAGAAVGAGVEDFTALAAMRRLLGKG
jgi:hypothetical protein